MRRQNDGGCGQSARARRGVNEARAADLPLGVLRRHIRKGASSKWERCHSRLIFSRGQPLPFIMLRLLPGVRYLPAEERWRQRAVVVLLALHSRAGEDSLIRVLSPDIFLTIMQLEYSIRPGCLAFERCSQEGPWGNACCAQKGVAGLSLEIKVTLPCSRPPQAPWMRQAAARAAAGRRPAPAGARGRQMPPRLLPSSPQKRLQRHWLQPRPPVPTSPLPRRPEGRRKPAAPAQKLPDALLLTD